MANPKAAVSDPSRSASGTPAAQTMMARIRMP